METPSKVRKHYVAFKTVGLNEVHPVLQPPYSQNPTSRVLLFDTMEEASRSYAVRLRQGLIRDIYVPPEYKLLYREEFVRFAITENPKDNPISSGDINLLVIESMPVIVRGSPERAGRRRMVIRRVPARPPKPALTRFAAVGISNVFDYAGRTYVKSRSTLAICIHSGKQHEFPPEEAVWLVRDCMTEAEQTMLDTAIAIRRNA